MSIKMTKKLRTRLPSLSSRARTPSGYPSSVKRMIAYQIERELLRQDVSRLQLAQAMGTSRAAINRLLDPENKSVTLQTLERVAELLGRRLQVFFQE